MLNTIFSDECLSNIIGHIKACWEYDYPTGKTLENAIFKGIKPFYSDAQSLGSPNTIVDVGKETQAFDIKGSKSLSHLTKKSKSSNNETNIFFEQTIPDYGKILVKIPNSIHTQVRRPKVDLKNFTGQAQKAIDDQINDYHGFAIRTTNEAGYEELISVVLLYGIDEKKGLKSVFLTATKFNIPTVTSYAVGYSKQKKPNAYMGFDRNNEKVFSLSSFNRGSSNFYKTFFIDKGMLVTWETEEENPKIYTRTELDQTCAIDSI
jgi:hypothetical protein